MLKGLGYCVLVAMPTWALAALAFLYLYYSGVLGQVAATLGGP